MQKLQVKQPVKKRKIEEAQDDQDEGDDWAMVRATKMSERPAGRRSANVKDLTGEKLAHKDEIWVSSSSFRMKGHKVINAYGREVKIRIRKNNRVTLDFSNVRNAPKSIAEKQVFLKSVQFRREDRNTTGIINNVIYIHRNHTYHDCGHENCAITLLRAKDLMKPEDEDKIKYYFMSLQRHWLQPLLLPDDSKIPAWYHCPVKGCPNPSFDLRQPDADEAWKKRKYTHDRTIEARVVVAAARELLDQGKTVSGKQVLDLLANPTTGNVVLKCCDTGVKSAAQNRADKLKVLKLLEFGETTKIESTPYNDAQKMLTSYFKPVDSKS